MTWIHVLMLTCAAIVWTFLLIFDRSMRFNAPTMFLEQSSNGIIVRQYPIERMLRAKGRVITMESVNKVQLTKNCLSIFQKSGTAYDMWVPSKFENNLLIHAKKLFPTAEFERV